LTTSENILISKPENQPHPTPTSLSKMKTNPISRILKTKVTMKTLGKAAARLKELALQLSPN